MASYFERKCKDKPEKKKKKQKKAPKHQSNQIEPLRNNICLLSHLYKTSKLRVQISSQGTTLQQRRALRYENYTIEDSAMKKIQKLIDNPLQSYTMEKRKVAQIKVVISISKSGARI